MIAPADIWANLPHAALTLTADRRIEAANPAAETFFNASSRTLQGRVLTKWLQSIAGLDRALDAVLDGASSLALNDVTVTPGAGDGLQCNLHVSAMSGTPPRALILIEPRGIAGRIDRALHARAAAKSAIGMADMLAHEIKNPLAGITGAAQLLSMSVAKPDRELTDLIVEESRRILALIEQVEAFGDLRPPQIKAINIHDVLERARRSAELGFAAHMTFADSYDPSLPMVAGDADQLLQVFMNLIKNAAQAQEKTGKITLKTRYAMRWSLAGDDGQRRAVPLHVEVEDDGPGIPPDIAANVFDPFVSGRENGTGLGLALVSKTITAHGGVIEADSVPGRTVIRVSLPVADARTGGE